MPNGRGITTTSRPAQKGCTGRLYFCMQSENQFHYQLFKIYPMEISGTIYKILLTEVVSSNDVTHNANT